MSACRTSNEITVRLYQYLAGERTAMGSHGVPSAIRVEMANSAFRDRQDCLDTMTKYVTEPLWHMQSEIIIERAIEHTRDWLWSYAPTGVRRAYKTLVTRSEVRRLECDLDELFTEALWS